jgi:4-amino-4-deoxy-L-arabinose transferase-like glycosyltransferase
LILVYSIFGPNALTARLVQAVIVGILQPYLAFLIGRKIFGVMVGLAAAFVTGLYTYFIYYSATLMTEPFYLIAILASLLIAIRLAEQGVAHVKEGKRPTGRDYWLAIGLGLSLGAAILLRQLFLLMAPLIFLWIFWASLRRQFFPLVVSGLVIVVLVLPLTIYNYQRFQSFVLLNTNAGYALFEQSPDLRDAFRAYPLWGYLSKSDPARAARSGRSCPRPGSIAAWHPVYHR